MVRSGVGGKTGQVLGEGEGSPAVGKKVLDWRNKPLDEGEGDI
jgi:hypothetical protein